MNTRTRGAALLFLLLTACLDAAGISDVEALLVPPQVKLGMTLEDLRAAKPNMIDGPEAYLADTPQKKRWPTFMEVIDLGQPSQTTFWYLISNNRLVGLLKTRILVLVPDVARETEANAAYNAIVSRLGDPRQESFLRKGDKAFVPVRADVWADTTSRLSVYFIATNREITTAVVMATDFPMDQVFIHPDPKRFELENNETRTVLDIPRKPTQPPGAKHSSESPPEFRPSLNGVQRPTSKLITSPQQNEQSENWQLSSPLLWFIGVVILTCVTTLVWRLRSRIKL